MTEISIDLVRRTKLPPKYPLCRVTRKMTEAPSANVPALTKPGVCLSIDRQAIVDNLLFGEGRVSEMPYKFANPNSPWYSDRWTVQPYDPAGAKQAMIDAGFEDGFTIKSFVFPMAQGGNLNSDIAEAIAGFWEDNIGVTVERVVTEYRPTVRTKFFDRTTAGFTWTFTEGRS